MVEQDSSAAPLMARPRLDQRLGKAPGQASQVVLLVAPAGYGKTTLLRQWLSAHERAILWLWLTLDEADNDLSHPLAAIQASPQSTMPALRLPVIDAPSPLAYALSLAFRRAAEMAGRDWLLLLDDYHRIHQPDRPPGPGHAAGPGHLARPSGHRQPRSAAALESQGVDHEQHQ